MASGATGQLGSGAVQTGDEHLEPLSAPPAALPRWHLWSDSLPRPGYANMAIDQALLERANRHGESWLRLYRWEPYCLSFGRHEPATRRYDVSRIKALELDTVRRPTGGRAVWHARELTYAVAAPSSRFGSLKAAYLEIHRMIGDALVWLGARVSLAPATPAPALDAGACFAKPAGGELMAGGQKLVGSAQYRQDSALLQHGSILLVDNQHMVSRVTRGATQDAVGDGNAAAGGLEQAAGRRLAPSEVIEAISTAAMTRWPGEWTTIASASHVLTAAADYHEQFRSPAWTWER